MYGVQRENNKDSSCCGTSKSCADFGNMKKTKSVDFSKLGFRSVLNVQEASQVASSFSRRAARGSYSSSNMCSKESLSYQSDCNLNRRSSPNLYETSSDTPSLWSSDRSSFDEEERNEIGFTLPRISLAKVSVFILAIATLFDMALTQMNDRPRTVSLGSAAISSVTDTLSPILPFAGGLDLRRDDYWSSSDGNWFGTLQSVYVQVHDAYAEKKESKSASPKQKRSITKSTRVKAISAAQPFVTTEVISQLTLGEVTETFRYAFDSSNADFNEQKYISKLSQPRVKNVILAMKEAVDKSRGKEFESWVRSTQTVNEIDALKLIAAMRIFAEWRLLRLNPDGYKGFSVGMSLGHKDVVQNLVKIEEAIHSYFEYQLENGELRTPTLRELLQFEIDTDVHPTNKLPRLKEKSAGMGMLWVRRQFAYQTHLFDNVISNRYPTTKDAVAAAYKEVYDRFHGWAVQKIFNYSFQSAPAAEVIFRNMNPHRLDELTKQPLPITEEVPKDDNNTESNGSTNKKQNPVEQFLNHVGGEWDKLVSNVVKVFNKNKSNVQQPIRGGGQSQRNENDDKEEYITKEMMKDADEQIAVYLQTSKPLLKHLESLFRELNMDDPTRV